MIPSKAILTLYRSDGNTGDTKVLEGSSDEKQCQFFGDDWCNSVGSVRVDRKEDVATGSAYGSWKLLQSINSDHIEV